jgi:hypothetical protein
METLIKIQNELKVPKSNTNKFGNYKYRSAEDILEAVKPLLAKHKCTLVLTDEVVFIGNKLFLQASAKFTDIANNTTEIVKGFAEISEHKGMSSEQCTGTASSYARKYALNGLFLIDETENDIDSKDNTKETTQTLPPFTYPIQNLCNALQNKSKEWASYKDQFSFSDTQKDALRPILKELGYVI